MELRSQEFCSKALGGGVIQGEGARDCTGAMNEDKEDEADQELLRRQDPWKRQPDQLWRWERGEPDSLAFLVRCWRAGPSKCSSVFAVGRQGHGGGGGGGTHPLPDGLLAAPGQCQVDAIQCHPV